MNSLVKFKVKNYRSFYNEVMISLEATKNKEFSEFNTFLSPKKLLSKNNNELLKSLVYFGANASGKSNIIKAINYVRNCVLTSNYPLNNFIMHNEPFAFKDSACDESTSFEIDIIANDIFYSYEFEILRNEIKTETLKKRTNGRLIEVFNRKKSEVTIGNDTFNGKVNLSSLFLSYAATPFLSVKENVISDLKNVFLWFCEPNLIIIDSTTINKYAIYCEEKYAESALEFIKKADIGIENFFVEKREIEEEIPQLIPLHVKRNVTQIDLKTQFNVYDDNQNIVGKKDIYLTKDMNFHSDGTKRLFSILGIVLKVLNEGGVIFFDEIDSKLNFVIVDFILKCFNSIDKNLKNGQLICNAHNVLLMDGDSRRDQICFASKNKFGVTELYSLGDFKDIRKSDLFSKNYLAGFIRQFLMLKIWIYEEK